MDRSFIDGDRNPCSHTTSISLQRIVCIRAWGLSREESQARAYKSNVRSFELAFEHIDIPRERILHVAQSLFHDHRTAKELGMTTVWIDRRPDREGFGATPPADAQPEGRSRMRPGLQAQAPVAVPYGHESDEETFATPPQRTDRRATFVATCRSRRRPQRRR